MKKEIKKHENIYIHIKKKTALNIIKIIGIIIFFISSIFLIIDAPFYQIECSNTFDTFCFDFTPTNYLFTNIISIIFGIGGIILSTYIFYNAI